jgi:hypothetical protein
MYGMVGVMLTGLDHGAKLVTLPRFESESYLHSVQQHRVSKAFQSLMDRLILCN